MSDLNTLRIKEYRVEAKQHGKYRVELGGKVIRDELGSQAFCDGYVQALIAECEPVEVQR